MTADGRLLTDRQEFVLQLCSVYSERERDVAAFLGISHQAVHAHKMKALKRLQDAATEGQVIDLQREGVTGGCRAPAPWQIQLLGVVRDMNEAYFEANCVPQQAQEILKARWMGWSWGEIATGLGRSQRDRGNLCRTYKRWMIRLWGEDWERVQDSDFRIKSAMAWTLEDRGVLSKLRGDG